MSLVNVSGLTFAYEGSYDNVFENVSFQVDTNWKLGLTGRNGKGKTTFLNLLLGKYEYGGRISASVDFEYFPFEIEDNQMLTLHVIDAIYEDYEQWKLIRELKLMDMDEEVLYRQFFTLSKGEQTKVMLAVLFLKENSFLLIDEPTNHLDAEGRKTVSAYLKSKSGFILVSHDREFMDQSIDHILAINRNTIELQRGNFSSWWQNKTYQDNFDKQKNEKLKKDINRLQAAAKQKGDWADKVESTKIGKKSMASEERREYVAEKSRKLQARRKDIEKKQERAISQKEGLLSNIERADKLKLQIEQYHTDRLLEFDKVSVFYDNKEVCAEVSFSVERGDRVQIKGKNGSGKSSILKVILGEEISYTGIFRRGSQLKISYVSQDTSFLHGTIREYAEEMNIDESLFKAILRKLDFQRIQFEKDMKDFSEGQKKKVLIARSLSEKAHLYIWDEPLNYIDVFSRMQLEELLEEYKPTMIFVEHDNSFSEKITTKVVEI